MHLGTSIRLRGVVTGRYQQGVIIVKNDFDSSNLRLPEAMNIDEEPSELDLINKLTDLVREFDPDILTGYEVQSASWGYVIERARVHYGRSSLLL
jgi:DNA polymerase zeta